jgi:CPA1 family monovalent cation:H+ antiporter
VVRQELTAHLASERSGVETAQAPRLAHDELHRQALQAARQAVLAMRASDEIGDDAFHQVEEELDWLEMASSARATELKP